jgi:hypothetical protein
MGSIWTKLLGRSPVELAIGRGWTIHAVCEISFQDVLRDLKGSCDKDLRVTATLVPEPGNKFDAMAVRIEINGRTVGFLPRTLASSYLLDTSCECAAQITGGCELENGTKADFGVSLNLAWPPRPCL